nr:3-dehydrosphinganine reductase TSC10A-like [Tanacetum cinerariifolium]
MTLNWLRHRKAQSPLVYKPATGRMINGAPCGLFGMVIKNLDLEPKIDAMMRDFLNSSQWKKLSKETGSKILPSGDRSRRSESVECTSVWHQPDGVGSQSGIGLALGSHFASECARVTILARELQKLEEAKTSIRLSTGINVDIMSADVTDYDSVKKVVESLDRFVVGNENECEDGIVRILGDLQERWVHVLVVACGGAVVAVGVGWMVGTGRYVFMDMADKEATEGRFQVVFCYCAITGSKWPIERVLKVSGYGYQVYKPIARNFNTPIHCDCCHLEHKAAKTLLISNGCDKEMMSMDP